MPEVPSCRKSSIHLHATQSLDTRYDAARRKDAPPMPLIAQQPMPGAETGRESMDQLILAQKLRHRVIRRSSVPLKLLQLLFRDPVSHFL